MWFYLAPVQCTNLVACANLHWKSSEIMFSNFLLSFATSLLNILLPTLKIIHQILLKATKRRQHGIHWGLVLFRRTEKILRLADLMRGGLQCPLEFRQDSPVVRKEIPLSQQVSFCLICWLVVQAHVFTVVMFYLRAKIRLQTSVLRLIQDGTIARNMMSQQPFGLRIAQQIDGVLSEEHASCTWGGRGA
jgi:hypothetical protein